MKRITYFLVALTCIINAHAYAQTTFENSGLGLTVKYKQATRLTDGRAMVGNQLHGKIKAALKNDVLVVNVEQPGDIKPEEFAGVFFKNIPGLKQGVGLWRYKPWNSWTKPVAINDATKMPDWDVQFFYWQYADGVYGAAVPLSGNGFRTTFGSTGNRWGSKAVSYAQNGHVAEVPAIAVAFGKDPYLLFAQVYKAALQAMGKGDNLFIKKELPEVLQYIGWCTWNSSDAGKNLNAAHIINGVKTFTDKKFPLGWVLVDDGWFQNKNSQLQSLEPDPKKFPNGFKPLITELKQNYGIKYTGVWHAFDGYWNGIDPDSELGKQYQGKLFSWKQKERVDNVNSPEKEYYFIKPEGNNLYNFYSSFHRFLKSEGFDFIKVDNQLVVERMAAGNYPIFTWSEKMHEALYKSANETFNGALINCMDMTAEAYANFGSSPVARTVEDYFPYEKKETYNLERGNAAAHVLQAIYNSLYFSQMVYTDYDMFQSHNPNAVLHALARTLNNGPIYLTDEPGKQNFDILNRLVYSDGRSIRAQTSLQPVKDCLFQIQQPQLFKAFSKIGDTGLLLMYNAADASSVSGSFKAADVNGIKGNSFAVYEYFSGKMRLANAQKAYQVSLPRLGYQLQYVVPVKSGFAAFGLVNKYNAPATIISCKQKQNKVDLVLYEGGHFRSYCAKSPVRVLVNGKRQKYSYQNNLLTVDIDSSVSKPNLSISW